MVFIEKTTKKMNLNIAKKAVYKVRSRWAAYCYSGKQKAFRKKVLDYYAQHPPQEGELKEAVNYLASHRLTTFYGTFQEKYDAAAIAVFIDAAGLPYVVTEGKRLYFKRRMNKHTVRLVFNALRMEQDAQSPHCYTDEHFKAEEGDTLADVGCAEGYFSLLNIEKVKRVYLFEQDAEWIEALEATFAPWKEKVTIVPKFVSDREREDEISLDRFFEQANEKPDFYKIDVEGAEKSVLNGMQALLRRPRQKIALCTYHRHADFETFSRFFEERGYAYCATDGLMIFQNDMENARPPYFRKCVLKARKEP